MKIYIFLFIVVFSATSCKKMLEQYPTDFSNPTTYFNTEEELNFGRTAVYNQLGASTLFSNGNYLYAWEADIVYMNRTTLTAGPWNYFFNPSDGYVTGYWTNIYIGINRANVVLANVDNNPQIPQARRDVIRGEMLFLRGFFYYMLAAAYGGVPLKLEPTSSIVDVHLPRATLKETYDQIIADMEAAEPLVPHISELGFGGAVSKSAVRGFLARVNLAMAGQPLGETGRYAEARKWAKMVIDDPAHMLISSYPQVFINIARDEYDIRETIFEVEFWGNNTGQYLEAGNNAWINGPNSTNPETGIGSAYMTTTSKFYDAYEDGDDRKFWNIAHFTYAPAPAPGGTKNLTGIPTQTNKNLGRPAKYRREYETLNPKTANNTPQNCVVLRLSDIMLMFAEADNEVNGGPTQEAIEAVNKVRRRGWSKGVKNINIVNGGSGYTTAPTVSFSAGTDNGVIQGTAIGTATISGGQVTAINLVRDSTGVTFFRAGNYTTPPTITISGGGGSGAEAVAEIYTSADADLTNMHTASKASFLELIQNERLRELNMEYVRKFDLIRWGIFLQVNQDMSNKILNEWPAGTVIARYYSNVTQRDIFWPIPTAEIVSNNAIEQNPGW